MKRKADIDHLPETAQRLLNAAKHIVLRDGYGALTMSAIGEEADEFGSLVHYYFGGKAGLVSALVKSMVSGPRLIPRAKIKAQAPGYARIRILLEAQRSISARRDFRALLELLPQVLSSRALRTQIAREYELVRTLDSEYLAPAAGNGEAAARHLAALSIAVLDGLGLQRALDSGFDHAGAYELWAQILKDRAARFAPPTGDARDDNSFSPSAS